MESPGLIWIPTGVARANLRYLVAHETAHQWFYGLVGNDQARQPFADEAAADFVARYVLGLRRASRCATAALDLSIYALLGGLLLREDLHPGRQPARRRARAGWARPRSGRRCAATSRRTGTGSSTTPTLLDALDAGDVARPRATLFAAALPAALLTAGTAPRRRAPGDPAVRGERLRHLPEAAGSSGRQARQPATSQAETARSRGPHGKP